MAICPFRAVLVNRGNTSHLWDSEITCWQDLQSKKSRLYNFWLNAWINISNDWNWGKSRPALQGNGQLLFFQRYMGVFQLRSPGAKCTWQTWGVSLVSRYISMFPTPHRRRLSCGRRPRPAALGCRSHAQPVRATAKILMGPGVVGVCVSEKL